MDTIENFSRRQFLVTTAVVAGGMGLGLSLSREADAATARNTPWPQPMGKDVVELNPYVTIAPDDTVVVRVTMPEMGNGAMTQACMNVAEELQADWSKMKVEYAPFDRDYREKGVYSKNAGGPLAFFSGRSTSDEKLKVHLQVGASARERLKAAAAAQWKVPVAEIEAANSVLTHKPTGRKLRYGEVAAKAALVKLDKEPELKPREQWTLLGKATPGKLNNPQIVDGSAVFGIDVRLPGMLYAALRQAPVHGGKLKSIKADTVKNLPGVKAVIVIDPTEPRQELAPAGMPFGAGFSDVQWGVAVVAEHYWQARKALDALPIEWDDGAGAKWKNTQAMVDAAFAACDKEGERIERSEGKALELVDKQEKLVEGSYMTPYCDQCMMEPLNATALVTADKVEVWAPTQLPSVAFYTAAGEAGLPMEKVVVNGTYIGGGYGRRGGADDVRMAVAIAKKLPGIPVQTIWTREETMRQGRYRPLVATKLKAGLGKDGLPVALVGRVAGKGFFTNGLHNTAYTVGCIPNVHIESQTLPIHLMGGAYRGPGYNSHAFILETFIDECAVAAGIDPLEYRLKLLAKWPDAGWTKVLKEVASKSGWGKKLPKGQGQGIAIANWGMNGKPEHGTTVACVATVEVSRAGKLNIQALDVAFDTGGIMNKDAVAAQFEGGAIFGLNMSLNEILNVQDGRVVEGNYDRYPILRGKDVPKINIHFGGLSGHERFSEVGEPPIGPIGPAIGNAIFKATGKRLRSTPFRLHDLSWA